MIDFLKLNGLFQGHHDDRDTAGRGGDSAVTVTLSDDLTFPGLHGVRHIPEAAFAFSPIRSESADLVPCLLGVTETLGQGDARTLQGHGDARTLPGWSSIPAWRGQEFSHECMWERLPQGLP